MKRSQFTIHNSQFTFFLGLVLVLLSLLAFGQWRATATGPQVQVPMFYDAHYLYPRPWTQAQAAPGVPDPFPVAFYGANAISQSFINGVDRLTTVETWLRGPSYGRIVVTLADESGLLYSGGVDFGERPSGGYLRFTFPPIAAAKGRTFTLTLAAPEATADAPAITRVVGGDRLGGSLRLNEFQRPGNLELRTYAPGRAALDALAEQLLPAAFRLRLQQYKPEPFKGGLFAVLLTFSLGLTGLFLVLVRPAGTSWQTAVFWLLTGLLALFLAWQIGSGRVWLPFPWQVTRLAATAFSPQTPITDEYRIVHDLTAVLWTAERLPEKRFVTTDLADFPAIRVPADSALEFALDVPRNGRFRTGVQLAGEGALRFVVTFNGQVWAETAVATADGLQWLEVDLAPWQGQGGILRLITQSLEGDTDGLWLTPQLLARTDWLLADLPVGAIPMQYSFGEGVTLAGYVITPAQPQPGDRVEVTLYWRGERPLRQNATVFLHALNQAGELAAQSDSQPVQNSYPLTNWPPGFLIADAHSFTWPADAGELTQLAVGLYDPATFVRWPVTGSAGVPLPDGQILLPVEIRP